MVGRDLNSFKRNQLSSSDFHDRMVALVKKQSKASSIQGSTVAGDDGGSHHEMETIDATI
jgi:hypothetical protein